MQLFLGFGVTAVYVVLFGPLARSLLNAPRTIGLEPRIYEFFLVLAAALVGLISVKLLVERWKRELGCRPGRPVGASARSTIANRLTLVAISSLGVGIALVVADRATPPNAYTPYSLMLFLVSLAGSLLVESLKKSTIFELT